MMGRCPVCDQAGPCNHAVEWDNGEPAPGSGKWGMSVCPTCQKGVDGEIEPWDWVIACVTHERMEAEKLREELASLRSTLEDAIDTIGDAVVSSKNKWLG